MKKLLLFTFIFVVFIWSCTPSRYIEPLKKDQNALQANIGGPLINYEKLVIPVPLTAVGYARGVTENITLNANLHTTALLFGVVMTDVGMVSNIYKADSSQKYTPSISINPVLNFGMDTWEGNAKLWPQININAYWHFGEKQHLIYAGIENWFELNSKKAHNQKQETHWIFNPFVGTTLKSKKLEYQIEVKMLAPNQENDKSVVEYTQIYGKKGATGLYFSIYKKF